jgi:hypothetical protein
MVGRPRFILIDRQADVQIFETAESLVSSVEAVDVADGEYPDVFDSDGRRLALCVSARPRFLRVGPTRLIRGGRVELRGAATASGDAQELSERLRALLGDMAETRELSLPELIPRVRRALSTGGRNRSL